MRAIAVVAVLAGGGGMARAEGLRTVSLAVGYAHAAVPEASAHGAALALDHTRAVTSAIALRAALAAGTVWFDDGATLLAEGILGIRYSIDVLRYVPYVDLGLGGLVVDEELDPAIELGVGLDVLLSRTWSVSPTVRIVGFLAEDTRTATSAGLRLTYRWGFF